MGDSEICWVGIDVAQETFDAAVARPGQHAKASAFKRIPVETFERTERGTKAFVAWLRTQAPAQDPVPARVVMEATGVYSIELTAMLCRLCPELGPAIANPEWTSAFRDSLGLRNKTDRMDARALAFYGLDRHPDPYEPMSREQAELRELSRCRDDLVQTRTAQANRLAQESKSAVVRKTLKALVARLDRMIERIERAMRRIIESDDDFRRDYALLTSIPGVGFVTAAVMLAELGNLRRFGAARQIGAQAGVTPAKTDSGKQHKPGRMSKKGNARVRQALYMAALSATVFNPPMKRTFERLRANGKEPMVALGAVMRKLAVLMRAIVISGIPFDPCGKPCGKTCQHA